MNSKTTFISGFILSVLLFCTGLKAQEDTLLTDDIVVVRSFEPTISNAIKLTTEPEIIKPQQQPPAFEYEFLPLSFQSDFTPDTIKAAKIKGEPLSRLYKSYVEGGIGNYLTTYGKVRINNTRSRNGLWGIALDHRAANEGIDGAPFSGYSQNAARVHGTRFLKKHEISGSAGFSRDGIHYYGYPKFFFAPQDFNADDIDKDDIRRTYNLLNAKASIQSFHADSNALNYKGNLQYDYLFSGTLSDVNEHRVLAETRFQKYQDKVLTLVDFNIDYNSSTAQTANPDIDNNFENLLISLGPAIEANGENYRAFFGVKAFAEHTDETSFRFYPNVHLSYNVYENYIIPYAGVTGGIERNNINQLRMQNPFINPGSELRNENTRYDVYGGIRGAMSSNMSFNVKASYRELADHTFFAGQNLNMFSNPALILPFNSTIDVMYDTLRTTQLTAELTYFDEGKLNATLRADYYGLEPLNLPRAWHLPRFTSTLTARYNLRDRIYATADFFFVGSRDVPSTDITDEPVTSALYTRTLKPYFDANLGIEYKPNKLGLFVRAHNLLAMRYEIWQNHPSQRFKFIFGFSYNLMGD